MTVADPVLLANGEFREEQMDLSVSSIGIPFEWQRNYSSQVEYDGPLGHKWDSPVLMRAVVHFDTNGLPVMIESIDGKGSRTNFSRWDQAEASSLISQPLIATVDLPPATEYGPANIAVQAPTTGDYANPPMTFLPHAASAITEFFVFDAGWSRLLRVDAQHTVYEYTLTLLPEQIKARSTLPGGANQYIDDTYDIFPPLESAHAAVQQDPHLQSPPVDQWRYKIAKVRTNLGHTIHFTYDDPLSTLGRLIQIQDSQGRSYTVDYVPPAPSGLPPTPGEGRIKSVTDPFGRVVEYSYNGQGDLATVTELPGTSAEAVTEYEYYVAPHPNGGDHLISTIRSPEDVSKNRGPYLRNVYNSANLVILQELGAAAQTVGTQLDPGNTEPAYRLQWESFAPGASEPPYSHRVPTAVSPPIAPTLPRVKKAVFTTRTGGVQEYVFASDGELTSKTVFDGTTAFTTTYTFVEGRLTSITYPPVNGQSTTETKTHDSSNLNILRRGNLLQQVVGGATGSATHTYGDFDPIWNIARFEEAPTGVQTTRSIALVTGSSGGFDGYVVTETLTPRAGSGDSPLTSSVERDRCGRVIRSVAPNGIATELSYTTGTSWLHQKTQDADGAAVVTETLFYDQRGNAVERRDARGFSTHHVYDQRDNLVETSYPGPDNYKSTFEYDANGRLLAEIHPVEPGVVRRDELERDVLGAVVRRRVDAGGALERTWVMELDASGRLVRRTSPAGRVVEYLWSDDSQLLTVTQAPGTTDEIVASHDYDALRRLIRVDAGGISRRFEYDDLSRRVASIGPSGLRTEFSYSWGVRSGQRDIDGAGAVLRELRHELDGFSRPKKTERLARYSDGTLIGDGWLTTTYEYDAMSRVVLQEDEQGAALRTTYDSLGRVVEVEDPLGHRKVVGYVPGTKYIASETVISLVASAPSVIQTSTHSYDEMGRRSASNIPGLPLAAIELDFRGRTRRGDLPGGGFEENVYNVLGELVERRGLDASGATVKSVSYAYDADSFLTTTTDALGRTTTQTRDALGRVVAKNLPGGTGLSWEYDANSQMRAVNYPDGSRIEIDYNSQGLISQRRHLPAAGVAGVNGNIDFIYDAAGRRVAALDGDTAISWTYTTLDDVEAEFTKLGSFPVRVLQNQFNSNGLLSSQKFIAVSGNDDPLFAYDYDLLGRPVSCDVSISGQTFQFGRSYLGKHLVDSDVYPNGVVVDYVRDADLRGIGVTHSFGGTTTFATEHVYDARGRRVFERRRTNDGAGGFIDRVLGKNYDDLGRVEVQTFGISSPSWPLTPTSTPTAYSLEVTTEWSAVDSRQLRVLDGPTGGGGAPLTEVYSTGSRHNYLTIDDGLSPNTLTYDANDSLRSMSWPGDGAVYEYDANRRLVRAVDVSGDGFELYHDALSRVVKKVTWTAGAAEIECIYSNADRPALIAGFVPPLLEDVRRIYCYMPQDQSPFMYLDKDTNGSWNLFCIHYDDDGDALGVTDSGGTWVERYEAKADFAVGVFDASSPTVELPMESARQPFLARGKYFDGRVGRSLLYRSGARHLDAQTGAYLQADFGDVGTRAEDGPTGDDEEVSGYLNFPGYPSDEPEMFFGAEASGGGGPFVYPGPPRPLYEGVFELDPRRQGKRFGGSGGGVGPSRPSDDDKYGPRGGGSHPDDSGVPGHGAGSSGRRRGPSITSGHTTGGKRPTIDGDSWFQAWLDEEFDWWTEVLDGSITDFTWSLSQTPDGQWDLTTYADGPGQFTTLAEEAAEVAAFFLGVAGEMNDLLGVFSGVAQSVASAMRADGLAERAAEFASSGGDVTLFETGGGVSGSIVQAGANGAIVGLAAAKVVSEAAAIVKENRDYGKAAEKEVLDLVVERNDGARISADKDSPTAGRRPDIVVRSGGKTSIVEVKTGSLGGRATRQLQKDAAALVTGKVDNVTWVIFPGRTGRGGFSRGFAREMIKAAKAGVDFRVMGRRGIGPKGLSFGR